MKYIYLTVIAFAVLLLSCKDDDTVGFERTFLNNHTVRFLDYSNLPEGSLPRADKFFSEDQPAKLYLPEWLADMFFMASDNSTVIVSYDYFNSERPAYLNQLNPAVLELDYRDYKTIWGLPYVNSLTPLKNPATELPAILQQKIANPKEGDKQLVEYVYSDYEPYTVSNSPIFYVNEDFSKANADINNLAGWENISRNISRTWKLRSFGTYSTAMATANGSAEPRYTKLDSWLITKELDLTQAVDPKFSFDMGMGYYSNKNFFSVLVSSEFESGTLIDLAEWEDISGRLNIPQSTTVTTYGPLIKYGEISLSDYVGKKIRIGFRYTGEVNLELNRSTTYELDNILVHEIADQTLIKSTRNVAEVYLYSGGNWKPVAEAVYALQQEDYTYLNLKYIERDEAAILIPNVLKRKTGLSTTENVVVVYKSGITGKAYADEFAYIDGNWVQTLPPTVVEKQDVYIFQDKKWLFREPLD